MALIVCPHCGRQVSDTEKTCIHCGKSIGEGKPMQAFERLGGEEKTELFRQFGRAYPKYVFPQGRQKAAKARKISTVFFVIATVLCGLSLLARILVDIGAIRFDFDAQPLPVMILVTALLAGLFSWIAGFGVRLFARRTMRRFLLFAKLFQAWLSARGIQFTFVFAESEKKYKKYYDNIDPALYLKEGS